MRAFLKKHRRIWMLMSSGFLTGLCLVQPKLGFLQWISVIPAAVALISIAEDRAVKLRKAYGSGLLYFMCYYVVSYHWFFYMYPLEFTGIGKGGALAVVLVATLGLSFLQALGGAFVFLTVAWFSRFKILEKYRLLLPFLAAADWTVFEWSQTFGWWGVPWGRMPLGQIDYTVLVRSSALLGSYFVTFALIAVNFALAYLILHTEVKKLFVITAAGLFSLNFVMGLFVTVTYKEEGSVVRVAALQGNISSSEKWGYSFMDETIEIYEKLMLDAKEEGATLVLTPETAFPYRLRKSKRLSAFFKEFAAAQGLTVLVSAFDKLPDAETEMNVLLHVSAEGVIDDTLYAKQKLVPFGEFVPMRDLIMVLIPPLGEIGMLDSDLMPGEESTVLETREGSIGCCLCFDSIYENVSREAVLNGAEMIAVSTNDSWFSDSAALKMHNAQSRLRAVETGRYVLRSANTGISSVIDPLGNVKKSLGADERGIVVYDVYMRSDRTLYTYIGNLFVYLCIAAIASYFIIACVIVQTERSDFSDNRRIS